MYTAYYFNKYSYIFQVSLGSELRPVPIPHLPSNFKVLMSMFSSQQLSAWHPYPHTTIAGQYPHIPAFPN